MGSLPCLNGVNQGPIFFAANFRICQSSPCLKKVAPVSFFDQSRTFRCHILYSLELVVRLTTAHKDSGSTILLPKKVLNGLC